MSWRLGRKVPINVYDEDRPVCQCHTVTDARLIVKAVNRLNSVEMTKVIEGTTDEETKKSE